MKRIFTRLKKLYVLIRFSIDDMKIIVSMYKYERENCDARKFAYLRACCHVLDKGLEADNFQVGHGKAVFKSAILYRDLLKSQYSNDPSFQWACNVIDEYEYAQKEGSVHRKVISTDRNVFVSDLERNTLIKILKSRTSCRNYQEKEIELKTLNDLVSLAIEAPVGCCRQTVRFYITQDSEIIKVIQKSVSGMTCFSHIPCVVLVYAKSSVYNVLDRRMQYIDCSLAVENFVLAAHAYNLGTTICNFSSASKTEEKAVSSVLKVPSDESPVVAITLGYPTKVPRKPIRMDINEFYKLI